MIKEFVLASASLQRKLLLAQIGIEPEIICPANIDETPYKQEKPTAYIKRMALEKAKFVAKKYPNKIVLASDTIIVCGRRIIQKAQNELEQAETMKIISGKAHKVMSAVCIIDKNGKEKIKISTTKIIMKRLSNTEIKNYVDSKEWVGCAGYKIEGCLAALVKKIIGSYSGVVGLPLYETKNLLESVGIF